MTPATRFHAQAAFEDERKARVALGRLRSLGLTNEEATIALLPEDLEASYAEMREEMEEMGAGPFAGSPGMMRGSLHGAASGAALGLPAGLLLAWVTSRIGYAEAAPAILVAALTAGLVIGFVLGGFLIQDRREWLLHEEEQPGVPAFVGVHVQDPERFAQALAGLQALRPLRLDRFNMRGEVLSFTISG